jgi:hypothetical protein
MPNMSPILSLIAFMCKVLNGFVKRLCFNVFQEEQDTFLKNF